MELNEYVRILRRNWVLVLGSSVVGLLLAAVITLTTAPTYTATTQLFVALQNSGSVAELQQGNSFSQARVKSYVGTATSPAVLQPAIDELGLEIEPETLASRVNASADLNTVLISISVDDESPVQSAALAQAIANSLITVVETLERPADTAVSPVRLSIITPAAAPGSPSSPNTKLNLLVGLLVGLVAGVAGALIRHSSDTKVRGQEDLAKVTSAPLLGGISFDNDAAKKPLLTQTAPQSPRAESFRQIRTNLQFANVDGTLNTFLVTSSLPGEGKTTTATNIAIAMAQTGQKVVLVDADLRRPMVASYLGLEGSAGLTTALVGSSQVEDLLQPWGNDDLYVLTSGRIPPNPSEILGSGSMSSLLDYLSSTFDVVVVDAPPLIPVTDATVLAQMVGGVMLVTGSGKVRNQDLEKSLESLKLVKANLLGVVLNLLPAKGPDAYAYSYYSYDTRPQDTHQRRSRAFGSKRATTPSGKRFRSKSSQIQGLTD